MVETVRQCVDAADDYRTDTAAALRATSFAVRITLTGQVQGVGFRPFVYRLAKHHGLTGTVQNRMGQVDIVACGRHAILTKFREDLIRRAPPLSKPRIVKILPVDTAAYRDFDIIESSADAEAQIFVPPDYFMCEDCRSELGDPADRRYRYPFINCTQCGPRYTLIERLPYDRIHTSMAEFPLCGDCEAEYRNPADRRFHAEPVACPACGPTLEFVSSDAVCETTIDAAINRTIECLRDDGIVAVKGIGGYHLMCDARSDKAVDELRRRKQRPSKPLAVMFPVTGDDGLEYVNRYVELQPCEAQLLASPGRPIVLATKRRNIDLAHAIAPDLGELGVFLPYSPLHQMLLDAIDGPLVATSGNISGEPVLTDNAEVTRRLGDVASAYLHHNRRIVRPADDPVYRRLAGKVRPLRIGRGSAPVEISIPWRLPEPVLAVGGHMKGTVALAWDNRVVVSPHIGEMDSPRSLAVFEQTAADLQSLYGVTAKRLICDAHPGYTTHRWANSQTLPVETVWHHRAHASALATEADPRGDWLVFTWDGVGLGEDGALWGGEALFGTPGAWKRVGSLRPFRLPGGDRAGREPWRSAAALHWECGMDWDACPDPDDLAKTAWQQDLNCPQTSAAGRLFDAAAALITGQTHVSFEAQGPMVLEALCKQHREPVYLSLAKDADGILRSDWHPLLALMSDTNHSESERAEIFHSTLALAILQQARRIRDEHSINCVGLTGGVFQNRVLTEEATGLLQKNGFSVYLAEKLPCNDAALSFGQVAEYAARSVQD